MTTSTENVVEYAGYARLDKKNIPQQIVNQIQEHIAAQRLKSGDQLPSERELSTLLNVSRSAVREAVKILVSIEILEVKHGRSEARRVGKECVRAYRSRWSPDL